MEMFYGFLAAGFIMMILEILTPGMFFFFSLGISGLITGAISILVKDFNVLLIIFSVFAIVVYLIMRRFNVFNVKEVTKTNADRYIGKKVRVLSLMADGKVRVKIYGEEWTGICGDKLEIGDEAAIEKIEGITLYLKK